MRIDCDFECFSLCSSFSFCVAYTLCHLCLFAPLLFRRPQATIAIAAPCGTRAFNLWISGSTPCQLEVGRKVGMKEGREGKEAKEGKEGRREGGKEGQTGWKGPFQPSIWWKIITEALPVQLFNVQFILFSNLFNIFLDWFWRLKASNVSLPAAAFPRHA